MKTEIVKVNNIEIECPFENGTHFVSIKPVCEALGIDHKSQYVRIKRNEILKIYLNKIITYGKDQKRHKMLCLPLKYIFG